jgi:hypothetical protein
MSEHALINHPVALVDILDRVLGKGVVVSGEIVIGIADVDLVRVSLRALLASIRADTRDAQVPGLVTAAAGEVPR